MSHIQSAKKALTDLHVPAHVRPDSLLHCQRGLTITEKRVHRIFCKQTDMPTNVNVTFMVAVENLSRGVFSNVCIPH